MKIKIVVNETEFTHSKYSVEIETDYYDSIDDLTEQDVRNLIEQESFNSKEHEEPYINFVKERGELEEEKQWTETEVIGFEEVGRITNGPLIEWHGVGRKKVHGNYKNGKEEGLWTEWFENGNKKVEGNYKGGREKGVWTMWYENGQKEREGNYKNGRRNGLWMRWYDDGRTKLASNYLDGRKDGLWIYWDKEGNVTKTETCEVSTECGEEGKCGEENQSVPPLA